MPTSMGGAMSFESESAGSAMDPYQHVTCLSSQGYSNDNQGFRLPTNQAQQNLGSDTVDYTFIQNMLMGMNANSSPTQIPQQQMSNYGQYPTYSMGPNSNFPGFPNSHYPGGNHPNSYMFKPQSDIANDRFKQCKMEPPSPYNLSGTVKNLPVQSGSSQWITSSSGYQQQHQDNPEQKYGVPQQQMQNQPMVSLSQETGLSSEINADMSSVVSSQPSQQYHEEGPDMESLWNSLS